MGLDETTLGESTCWESAHVCPECGHAIPLKSLELGEATTGIIACPQCHWSGQINIQVVKQRPLT